MNTRTVYNTTYEYINYRYVFTPINNHVARITTLLRCRLPHDEYFERVGARTHVPRDESNLLRGAPTKLEKTNCILYMCICLIPMCIWYYSQPTKTVSCVWAAILHWNFESSILWDRALENLEQSNVKSHLAIFVIGILPKSDLVIAETEPAAIPGAEAGHVFKHSQEASQLDAASNFQLHLESHCSIERT